jgi:aspartyl-tRNA(Asn)/glutamyl-tRNA(Gln) amidotransferase subunit B
VTLQTEGSGRARVKLNGNYEPVIGLEVHAQMLTATKAFCGCSTSFGDEPNGNVCPVCLGMPGTLPVLNRTLVEFSLRMGVAVQARVSQRSLFARKNYFYPDLPKGYQITQFDLPICTGGWVEVDLDEHTRKRIGITRIHMEEDAGKSIHDLDVHTLVDANRCGVPLIEIVSEPDIRSPREASLYLTTVRQLVTYLGICDGNMEEGSFRCDANVSVRLRGDPAFGTKTEVKNMNSFRNVERALEYEINRQIQLIEDGGSVVQETLLWDADQNVAVPMRSKEEAHDYRYFPEPDLPPVVVDEAWLARLRRDLPELPWRKRDRFVETLGLPRYDAEVLTADRPVAEYFEEALDLLVARTGGTRRDHAKQVSNWVMTEILRVIRQRKITVGASPVTPERLAGLVALIRAGTISGKIAKEVFEEMAATGEEPGRIIARKGLVQVSDAGEIARAVEEVLNGSPAQVTQYLSGNRKVFGFFVGETMKLMKGQANPRIVNEILQQRLDARRL